MICYQFQLSLAMAVNRFTMLSKTNVKINVSLIFGRVVLERHVFLFWGGVKINTFPSREQCQCLKMHHQVSKDAPVVRGYCARALHSKSNTNLETLRLSQTVAPRRGQG